VPRIELILCPQRNYLSAECLLTSLALAHLRDEGSSPSGLNRIEIDENLPHEGAHLPAPPIVRAQGAFKVAGEPQTISQGEPELGMLIQDALSYPLEPANESFVPSSPDHRLRVVGKEIRGVAHLACLKEVIDGLLPFPTSAEDLCCFEMDRAACRLVQLGVEHLLKQMVIPIRIRP
jgi:hypothetical protein